MTLEALRENIGDGPFLEILRTRAARWRSPEGRPER